MIDPKSSSVTKLEMQRLDVTGEVVASSLGTGFFWQDKDAIYLITNWHNVTGVNPENNKMMDCFIPNAIEFTYFFEPAEMPGMIGSDKATIHLYADEVPQWLEHPKGRHVDCVAIPLPILPEMRFRNMPMNSHDWVGSLTPTIGEECFIIGYPKGMAGSANTPIWKRGSIASEPRLDLEGKPLLLVDTATRKGMSGSPVFIRHHGYHAPGKDIGNAIFGTVENFLGIYSGRIGDDELGVQLGRVWKRAVIDEIISAQKHATHPDHVI